MAATSSLRPISASFHFSPHPKPLKFRRRPPPISISTNPSHLDPFQIRDLLSACNLSCHRFPILDPDGRVDPVDIDKLRVALAHSSVVVSVFCKPKFVDRDDGGEVLGSGLEELFERVVSVPETDHRLVGFGRAVSDGGLTASIHDVAVIPSLQRRGIGRKIVERIIRLLTSRDIYDISALCTEKERLFFKSCGFGDDYLGSSTMMYTRTAPNYCLDNAIVRTAGRMLLLVPPPSQEPQPSKRISADRDDLKESKT
ncbi:GCN5-related N-acetyltransferase 3, chloroplastic [Typha latifolia]|uniref:GCN5-related N-acetyltransferase 3, chloroplastic n=1 Tax=Typha latifolia TaxID=4733 RepID=UPI003C2D7DF9